MKTFCLSKKINLFLSKQNVSQLLAVTNFFWFSSSQKNITVSDAKQLPNEKIKTVTWVDLFKATNIFQVFWAATNHLF